MFKQILNFFRQIKDFSESKVEKLLTEAKKYVGMGCSSDFQMESKKDEELANIECLKLLSKRNGWSEWSNWPAIESNQPGALEALAFNEILKQQQIVPKEVLELLESPVKVIRPAVVYDDDWSD